MIKSPEEKERDRYRVIPAVYVIFRRNDEILLLFCFQTGYRDGEYTLPAGHVEAGEGIYAAAVREAMEEVGVHVHLEVLVFEHVQHRSHDIKDGFHDRVDFYFSASSWDGELSNQEPDKCDDMRFFAIDQIPENVLPFVHHAILCISRREKSYVCEF